MVDINEEDFLI